MGYESLFWLSPVPKEQIYWLKNETLHDYEFCEDAKAFFDGYVIDNVCSTDYKYIKYNIKSDFNDKYALLIQRGEDQRIAASTFTDTLNCLLYEAKEMGYEELCGNIKSLLSYLLLKEEIAGKHTKNN